MNKPLKDILSGIMRWELYVELAIRESKSTYHGSILGQLWFTMGFAIFISIVGLVYTLVFEVNADTYLPFFCAGIMNWRFINNIISEGCMVFQKSKKYILGFDMPYSIFIFRSLIRVCISYLYLFFVYIVIGIIFKVEVGLSLILFLPGMLLVLLNSFWVMMILGILCLRYRDIGHVVNSITILLFFITPVFWPAKMIDKYEYLVIYNPLYHFLEVMRDPLIGMVPNLNSFIILFVLALFGNIVTIVLFSKLKSDIPYWF
jgi:ABC-type polysaccharide/polyol phosphate export permease